MRGWGECMLMHGTMAQPRGRMTNQPQTAHTNTALDKLGVGLCADGAGSTCIAVIWVEHMHMHGSMAQCRRRMISLCSSSSALSCAQMELASRALP